MEENGRPDAHVAAPWAEVVRAYCELMDGVMPHLPNSEQILYHRLFRLSHVQQSPFAKCRYEDLAPQCGVSLSTVRRAVKGLRAKKLIKTLWQSHSGTTFQVYLLSTLLHRPAFLPRPRRGSNFPPFPRAAKSATGLRCLQSGGSGTIYRLQATSGAGTFERTDRGRNRVAHRALR